MRARRGRAVRACGPAGRRGDAGGEGGGLPLPSDAPDHGAVHSARRARQDRGMRRSCSRAGAYPRVLLPRAWARFLLPRAWLRFLLPRAWARFLLPRAWARDAGQERAGRRGWTGDEGAGGVVAGVIRLARRACQYVPLCPAMCHKELISRLSQFFIQRRGIDRAWGWSVRRCGRNAGSRSGGGSGGGGARRSWRGSARHDRGRSCGGLRRSRSRCCRAWYRPVRTRPRGPPVVPSRCGSPDGRKRSRRGRGSRRVARVRPS